MIKAILSGHSRGLGAAIADTLLARGIPVLAVARSRHAELGARYPALLQEVALDLSDRAALIGWLATGALDRFVDGADHTLLINNAGLLQPVSPLGGQDPQAIADAVAVNVTAPLLLANAFVAATTGCGDRRVLHVSSGAASKAYSGWSVYGATKAALDHHARVAAGEALAGLRIASVAPGVIDTDMQAEIRATGVDRFPQRARFDALKAEGQLSAPADAARQLVDHLLSEAYGEQAVADLRTLAAPGSPTTAR